MRDIMAKRIESHQNKVFKRIKSLNLRKNREKEGVFIAEGLRFVSEIPSDWDVEMFMVSEDFAKEKNLVNYDNRAETYILTNELFALKMKEHDIAL